MKSHTVKMFLPFMVLLSYCQIQIHCELLLEDSFSFHITDHILSEQWLDIFQIHCELLLKGSCFLYIIDYILKEQCCNIFVYSDNGLCLYKNFLDFDYISYYISNKFSLFFIFSFHQLSYIYFFCLEKFWKSSTNLFNFSKDA